MLKSYTWRLFSCYIHIDSLTATFSPFDIVSHNYNTISASLLLSWYLLLYTIRYIVTYYLPTVYVKILNNMVIILQRTYMSFPHDFFKLQVMNKLMILIRFVYIYLEIEMFHSKSFYSRSVQFSQQCHDSGSFASSAWSIKQQMRKVPLLNLQYYKD